MSQLRRQCAGNSLCRRCGGLLVADHVLDFYGPMSGWKCVNCGWCCRENRQAQHIVGRSANGESYTSKLRKEQ